MRLRGRLLGWALCMISLMTAISAQALEPLRGGLSNESSPSPAFAPNELIVKLTPDAAVRWHAMSGHAESTSMSFGSSSLDALKDNLNITRVHALTVNNVNPRFVKEGQCQKCGSMGRMKRWTRVLFDGADSLQDLMARIRTLQQDSNVESVELNQTIRIATLPNDPYLASSGSWGQPYEDLWGHHLINASQAWSRLSASGTTPGRDIIVAVIDTGSDLSHPDLQANLWINEGEVPGDGIDNDGNGFIDDRYGYDFANNDNDPTDDLGHGTHVAGTIAAVGNNGQGIVGLAWDARIMSVKAFTKRGTAYISDIASAIMYAVQEGADVINGSFGGPGSSAVLGDAFQEAYDHGVVSVVAAGNSGSDAANYSPANLPTVITVAASDHNDRVTSFSNWGPKIDVAAPGGESGYSCTDYMIPSILSLRASDTDMYKGCGGSWIGKMVVGGDYFRARGTSMAAPHVSGVVAALLSHNPSLSIEEIRQVLRTGSQDIEEDGWDLKSGYGRLDFLGSLEALDAPVCTARIQSPAIYKDVGELETLDVMGTASGASCSSYVLDYGEGKQPTEWTPITTGSTPISSGLLGTLPVGTLRWSHNYTLRIRVQALDGREFTDRVVIRKFTTVVELPVSSFAQFNPILADMDRDGITEILLSDGYHGFICQPDGSSCSRTDNPVDEYEATLVAEDLFSNVPGLELVAASPDPLKGRGNRILHVYDSGGSEIFQGAWPIIITGEHRPIDGMYSTMPIADLEGDGTPDVIRPIKIWALDRAWLDVWTHLGEQRSGFPIEQSPEFQSAVTDDLDADGTLEIIVADRAGMLRVFSADGSELWAANIETLTNVTSRGPYSISLVTGDVDGDGEVEIVVMAIQKERIAAFNHVSRRHVLVFKADGSLEDGWPVKLDGTAGFMSPTVHPALADLDSDGDLEIIVATDTELIVLHHDGTMADGWPQPVSLPVGAPIIGDMDGDGYQDILIMTFSPPTLNVFQADGSLLMQKTIPSLVTIATVAIGDLDGDGAAEVIVVPYFSPVRILKMKPASFHMPTFAWPMFRQNAASRGRVEPTGLRGDVNEDGVVDHFDVLRVTRHLGGAIELNGAQQRLADVAFDRELTVADAMFILQYVDGVRSSLDLRTGDVDSDGKVTIEDAQKTLRIAVGLEEPSVLQRDVADVNADGDVDVLDALSILKFASAESETWQVAKADEPPAAEPQTPWQTNASGTQRTDIGWNYAMGYHFTPQVNGQITQLGGFFNGTKTVKLFEKSTGVEVASTSVTAANAWAYTNITPVNVSAGTTYTVAVYLAGSGASYRYSLNPRLPQTFEDVRIEATTYAYTSSNANARPTNSITSTMYGQADVVFVRGD